MKTKIICRLSISIFLLFLSARALDAACFSIIWEENDFPMGTTHHGLTREWMNYRVPREPPFYNAVYIESFWSEADAKRHLDMNVDLMMKTDCSLVSHQQNGETDRYVFVGTIEGYGEDEYLTRFVAFELYRYCYISVQNRHWEEDILLSDILSDVATAEAVVDSRCPPETITDAKLGVVGRPNQPDDLETAIIPPDDRFPARYRVRLTDKEGNRLHNRTLTVRVDNIPQARLSGNWGTGSEISITTDIDGEAEFTYTFLDVAPSEEPLLDEITIESANLGIQKIVKVSVGLRLSVLNVSEAWDTRTEVPRSLGLRFQVADAFHQNLDLAQYIADLKVETGRHLGVAVSTWWLNRPEPDTVQWIKDNVKGFTSAPPDVLYVNGRGWIKKVNEHYIVNAIDPPFVSVGPHLLPQITLCSEGMHLFEVRLSPVILPEEPSDPSVTYVKSAPSPLFFFGADVYGAESVFKSLVCAFSPTDADQFLMKAVVLDCPLLQTTEWVGAWAAGSAVPYVLLVAEVADLICNFMEGNYLNVSAMLAGKYLSRLESLRASGAITLTEGELSLLKKGLVTLSVKRFYDTYNDSVKHFNPPESRSPLPYQPLEDGEDWPEGLVLADIINAIESMSAGFLTVPQMGGFEVLVVVGTGPVDGGPTSENRVCVDGLEVGVILYRSGDGPGRVSANEEADLFRVRSLSSPHATVALYEPGVLGDNAVLWFVSPNETLAVDRNADGQADDFIYPTRTEDFAFLSGDMNLDGVISLADAVLALRMAVGNPSAEQMLRLLPWAVDIDGDDRLGVGEALYILGCIAGLR